MTPAFLEDAQMAHLRIVVPALFMAATTVAGLGAQAPSPVDFRRDVQPILRDHCYACHGPEQQMNGLRLDRRADAMRGGTQSVIGPGNAEGSRLYHRLVGTSVGVQMPPTGPLRAEQIAVLKGWIDQGAEWPDDLAGAAPSSPGDPDAERLASLIRDRDRAGVEALLRKHPRAAAARASGGSTPLMFAALYGDAALMKGLIDRGADPGAANVAGATALMWAVPNTDTMRLLLASDVNVGARSEDGRTALVTAAGIVGSAAAVRLLLEVRRQPVSGNPGRSVPAAGSRPRQQR